MRYMALPYHEALPYRVAHVALPTVWPPNLHHQPRACPCRVPSQPTLLPAPIPLSTQNCKKYISLVISAIKTRVMMNFNLLIVRDPVIFSNLVGADQGGGGTWGWQ